MTELIVPNMLVTFNAGRAIGLLKILTVWQKGFRVAFGSALQIFVATQAAGIINIVTTLFTMTMPVNIIRVFYYFHGRVNHAMNSLDPYIMNRSVMGNMAVTATGTPARRVIASVQGGPIGTPYRQV